MMLTIIIIIIIKSVMIIVETISLSVSVQVIEVWQIFNVKDHSCTKIISQVISVHHRYKYRFTHQQTCSNGLSWLDRLHSATLFN